MPAVHIAPDPVSIGTLWSFSNTFNQSRRFEYIENPSAPGTYYSVTYSTSTIGNPVIITFDEPPNTLIAGFLTITFNSTGYTLADEFKSIPRGSSDLVVPSTVIVSTTTASLDAVNNKVFSFVAGERQETVVTYTFYLRNDHGDLIEREYTHTVSATGYPGFSGSPSLNLKAYR